MQLCIICLDDSTVAMSLRENDKENFKMLDMKRVGQNIKSARTKKNMTQLELADIVGVSYQAVSNWERGNTMPDVTKIPDIAKALDIGVDDFFGDGDLSKTVNKVVKTPAEPLTTSEITEIAPILPPKNLEDTIEKRTDKESLNFDAIVGLAPFLEKEYLDSLIENIDIANIKDIEKLAPFLSSDTLAKLAKKMDISNINDFIGLAPFFPKATLDEFVKNIEPENIGKLASISPFLSWDAWDIITDKAISAGDVSSLLDVAPFLPPETLKKVADHILHSKNPSELSKFAAFL